MPTNKGPANEVIRPENANKPKLLPACSSLISDVIITRLALCIIPINIETTITTAKKFDLLTANNEA